MLLNGQILPVDESKVSLDELIFPSLQAARIQAHVLRLDKIHPVISGNKWFKLKYHLLRAAAGNYRGILTWGGAYSNHLVAAACAAARAGIPITGIVRGERPVTLSHTLLAAQKYGMDLLFTSRENYRRRQDPAYLQVLAGEYPDTLMVPEGGGGPEGIRGCQEILSLTDTRSFTDIICAAGTGTMFCGLLQASLVHQRMTGICVLKGLEGSDYEKDRMPGQNSRGGNYRIFHDYHQGGYAKKNPDLIDFMNNLYTNCGIPSDFVYTAKMFYGTLDLVQKGYFTANSRLLIIHSGGLQGNESLSPGTLLF